MEILTGFASVEDDGEAEENEVEEGSGEDEDEQGDVDVNDKEDTPDKFDFRSVYSKGIK